MALLTRLIKRTNIQTSICIKLSRLPEAPWKSGILKGEVFRRSLSTASLYWMSTRNEQFWFPSFFSRILTKYLTVRLGIIPPFVYSTVKQAKSALNLLRTARQAKQNVESLYSFSENYHMRLSRTGGRKCPSCFFLWFATHVNQAFKAQVRKVFVDRIFYSYKNEGLITTKQVSAIKNVYSREIIAAVSITVFVRDLEIGTSSRAGSANYWKRWKQIDRSS